jgi:hypothetical protein
MIGAVEIARTLLADDEGDERREEKSVAYGG